jgi:hypothetical protein
MTTDKITFRANVAKGIKDGKNGVDIEHGAIFGFSVITLGPAAGHGMDIDELTLDQVVELGNAAKVGIKSRFGHPNMSNDALGTFLGRVKNFYKDGDRVRADLHLDKTSHETPNGDLGSYVINLAETDPDAFGTSIVFSGEKEMRLNPDGTTKKDTKTGEALPPLARVKKLWSTDVVDEPAANSGMFGFFAETVKPSAEMTAFLDKFLMNPDAVEKVASFLDRYRTNKQTEVEPEIQKENKSMEFSDLNMSVLKEKRPDLADAFRKEGKEIGLKEGRESGSQEGIKQERERCLQIANEALSFRSVKDEALEAMKTGENVDKALLRFKTKELEELKKQANPTPGAGTDPMEEQAKFDALPLEERSKKEWEKSPELRKEFSENFEAFKSFKKATEEGRARILKK